MIITIDTEKPLSAMDTLILLSLLPEFSDTPEAEAPKNKHQKQEESSAAAVEAIDAEEFDAQVADDLKAEAVTRATALIAEGKREDVKAALKVAGVTRASELTDDNVTIFLEALDG